MIKNMHFANPDVIIHKQVLTSNVFLNPTRSLLPTQLFHSFMNKIYRNSMEVLCL